MWYFSHKNKITFFMNVSLTSFHVNTHACMSSVFSTVVYYMDISKLISAESYGWIFWIFSIERKHFVKAIS